MKTEQADPIFAALLRESSLASKMLGNGVTLLRDVCPGQSGALSMALFSLSIGLERAAKLALIVDHLIEDGTRFPTDRDLRNLGHDLEILFEKVVEIAKRRMTPEDLVELPYDPIHYAIINTLSEFARATRYYNLDFVVKSKGGNLSSPENAWFERVGNPIMAKHYTSKRRNRDAEFSTKFGGVLDNAGSVFRVLAHNGDWLQSARDLIKHEQETEFIQKFAQFYTLQIIRFFARTLTYVESAAHGVRLEAVPHFGEMFAMFLNGDAYLKSRKTWRP